ncbi:hypothetical protein OG689_10645 [Kitasatospora sp. NBC_00240]|uniref:hypothetical protein n=1 Tax=Kitasatospora sp. NBC_00240 TaxID=2903567 RepID=UPI00225725B5|nr:hypothetical protein [Kitasatospora sp. NBC_00240]MCX5209741.1 hypothetical protein [Kitasatospora sp. NBC_00240]
MNPATVLTITALAGAVGIWRLTRDSTPDRGRPAEPDTETAARQSGLITTPGEDQ